MAVLTEQHAHFKLSAKRFPGAAVACLLVRWGRSRHILMELVHRLTGR